MALVSSPQLRSTKQAPSLRSTKQAPSLLSVKQNPSLGGEIDMAGNGVPTGAIRRRGGVPILTRTGEFIRVRG